MYRRSQVIKKITTSLGKLISVGFVTHTDKWERKILDESVKKEFTKVAERHKDKLKNDTVKVVMKEKRHSSKKNPVGHFSVLEINKDEKVIASEHWD